MRLTFLKRNVSSSLSVRDREPKKALVRIGQLRIVAASIGKKRKDRAWTWSVWRRGIKTTKGVSVKVTSKFRGSGKWSKKKKAQRLIGTVTATYNLGYGSRIQTFLVYDRGPEYVRGKQLARYSIVYKTLRNVKTDKVQFGSQKSVSRNTLSTAKSFIKSQIASVRAIRVRAPVYIIIRPREKQVRAKHKSGYSSVADVNRELTKTRRLALERLAQADLMARQMERAWTAPDDSLRRFKGLPKEFRRTQRAYAGKGMKIIVYGFTKRVEKQHRALSEVLAYRLVRWWCKPAGTKRGRWQSVEYILTRWGRSRAAGASYAPSYSVTDEEGKDVIFAKPSPKEGMTEQDIAEVTAYEHAERITYTKQPLARARAELDKLALTWVRMLQSAPMVQEKPWMNVSRGEGKEQVGKYQIRIIKWGLRNGYPAIYTDSQYAYLGGVVLEVRRGRSKKVLVELVWDMVRPRTLKVRDVSGAVLLIGRGRFVIGSYPSAHRARNALRRKLNDATNDVRMGKKPKQ